MSGRHSRQRSSVSVKKRSSVIQDRTIADIDDIHDNALSKKETSVEPMQDYFSLGSPYPGTTNSTSGGGRMESTNHNDFDEDDDEHDIEWSEKENLPVDNKPSESLGEMTTRTELDFDEEEEQRSTSSSTSSQPPPEVPPKEMTPLPLKRIKDFSLDASAPSSPYAGSRSPALVSLTPSRQHGFSGPSSSTPTNLTGDRRLSLLAGGNVLRSTSHTSPSTSPSSVRTMTPTTAKNIISSPAKKIQPVKRMSLSYVPSPVTRTKFNSSMSYDSTTPSAVGTPPTTASSTSGYFSRLQESGPGTPRIPSTGSVIERQSSTSSSPALIRNSRREDGETVMTQHMDILGRIAQGERKILDLKEMLEKEERDLRQLQKEWQTSVNRELIASRPEASQLNGHGLPTTIIEGQTTTSTEIQDRRKEVHQAPTTAASDGWKAISARLAGAGNQLNAFIDQLAAPLPEEGRKSEESTRITTAGLGLDVLKEEAEEGDALEEGSKPIPPSKTTSKQTKRTSVFGNSMAVLQKQMEAQFGVVDITKSEEPTATNNGDMGGWGTWQKRLKEARENASGLLAKAEAKLGQALTMDDLVSSVPSNGTATSSSAKRISRNIVQNPQNGSNNINYMGENDREKAALAELSWLNSLAGINMSGTTDRVVTSQSPETRTNKGSGSAEQDAALVRKNSYNSRRESSQSHASTSRMTNTTSATTVTSGSDSPQASLNGEVDKGNKEQSFFSLISSGWGPDTMEDGRQSAHKKQPSLNGHSKTRIAAEVAMQGKRTSLPPAQDNDANDEIAWGLG